MPTSTMSAPKQPRRKRVRDPRAYQRRLKAAGLDNNTMPEDADAYRFELARRICMFLDESAGCPELLCQRNRGCMAPDNFCANVPQASEEEVAREWPRVRAAFFEALEKHLVARGVHDE